MGSFTGQLNVNEIYGGIYNMIISQLVFADNLDGVYGDLVDKARVDGSLYGDQKLYYSTDALATHAWGGDSEATNLLAVKRPKSPQVQAIVLDQFRQIDLTLDEFLSKRAFSDEGTFASFTAVMLGWVRETKRVYDARLYNVFFGTNETNIGGQEQIFELPKHDTSAGSTETAVEAEAINRLRGEKIAEHLANLLVRMKDARRDYNDYGHLRSYRYSKIQVVWNSDYVNQISKLDLPTIFNKDGLVNKFDSDELPSEYFGVVGSTSSTATGIERSTIEADYTVLGVTTHVFPGDIIPTGATLTANSYYTPDPTIICKVCVVLPPIMSAFDVATSFFNAKALLTNHYLTWGHNTLEHLKNYPFITIREDTADSANANKKVEVRKVAKKD